MSKITDEEFRQLGERIVSLVDDEHLKDDHLAFKLLSYLLVDNLRTQKTQLSARYLHRLTGIAIGHQKKVIERLRQLGYIAVRRIQGDAKAPPIITVQERISVFSNEQQNTMPISQAFTIGSVSGKRYRITVAEEEPLTTSMDTHPHDLQLS